MSFSKLEAYLQSEVADLEKELACLLAAVILPPEVQEQLRIRVAALREKIMSPRGDTTSPQ
ncbi:MAG: hypothetical protein AB7V27_16080 [Candidatus Binatia bacterium]